jgi:CO/xanthine dehydrogenase FAD-binding subunit
MNLNTVSRVMRPQSPEEIGAWQDGYAWLAGGTWLFSELQVAVDTLIDLDALGWEPLTITDTGLDIAATCRVAQLHAFEGPGEWQRVQRSPHLCSGAMDGQAAQLVAGAAS